MDPWHGADCLTTVHGTIVPSLPEEALGIIFPFLFNAVIYLDKCKFANANTAFGISNGYFSIVFYPSSPTEDVVYTGGDFIPHIIVSIPGKEHNVGEQE